MLKKIFLVSAIIAAFVLMTYDYSSANVPVSDKNEYIGASACGMCHKKESDGNQLKIWQESKHANAFKVLATEEAKKIASAKGIADAQKAAECLECHTSGYQTGAKLAKKFSIEDGVQCETCHGAGSEYKSMKVMKDHAASVAAGMTDYTKPGSIKAQCESCHNKKSPTFKGFDFEKSWKVIAHPIPKG